MAAAYSGMSLQHWLFACVFFLTTVIPKYVFADYCQGYTDVQSGTLIEGFQCPQSADEFEQYKCCGPSDGHYCCYPDEYDNYYGSFYWSVGKIIGVVTGSIAGVAVLVVIAVALCCCVIRYDKKIHGPQQTAATGAQQTAPSQAQRHNSKQSYPQPQHSTASQLRDTGAAYYYNPQEPKQAYESEYDAQDGRHTNHVQQRNEQVSTLRYSAQPPTYVKSQMGSVAPCPRAVAAPFPPEVAPPPPEASYY